METKRAAEAQDAAAPAAERPNCEWESAAYIATAIRTTWDKSCAQTSTETPAAKGRRDCAPPPSSGRTLEAYFAELDEIARTR